MTAPSYASEPQIQYLHQVLDQIASGELQVPDFQRISRWDDDQRKKLLDSVSHGYPIGAVMVWRTTQHLTCIRELGDRQLPESGPGTARQYLLDGAQRLATLFSALWAPLRDKADLPKVSIDARKPSEDRWLLGYHLVNREWVFTEDMDADAEEASVVIPGRILLSGINLLRFQRNIEHPREDELVEHADEIASAVREYKIAILPLVSESVEDASKTFGLVNSQGTTMSDLDLIHALTWSTEFNLRSLLNDAKDQLHSVGWRDFDEKYYLAIIRGVLDLDLYRGTAEEVGDGLKADPTVLTRSVSALSDAATFLRERCDVVGLGLLPYSYQAVLLADVFARVPAPSDELKEALEQWFWWTTVWGTFSGISGYRLMGMARYLRDLAQGKSAKWPRKRVEPTPLPATMLSTSARIHALSIILYRMQGSPDALRARLERDGASALVKGVGSSRDPGNGFLVTASEEAAFQEALEVRANSSQSGQQVAHELFTSPELREKHAISAQAWSVLGRGDVDGFIDERRKTIAQYEAALLDKLGQPPGCE